MAESKHEKLVEQLKRTTSNLDMIDIDMQVQDPKVRRSLKRLLQDRQSFLLKQIKAETEKL
jgi:hypothetical protein